MNATRTQNGSPRQMGELDLITERDRLEGLLHAGKLCTLDGSRLAEIRRCLKRLDELKVGSDRPGIG
jgi:hypothetical protein